MTIPHLWRCYLWQEPGALVAHAGIYAWGADNCYSYRDPSFLILSDIVPSPWMVVVFCSLMVRFFPAQIII
jgi:hypothetical protein